MTPPPTPLLRRFRRCFQPRRSPRRYRRRFLRRSVATGTLGRRVRRVRLHDWSLLELFGGRKVPRRIGSACMLCPGRCVCVCLLWTKVVDLFSVLQSMAHKRVGCLAHSDSPPQTTRHRSGAARPALRASCRRTGPHAATATQGRTLKTSKVASRALQERTHPRLWPMRVWTVQPASRPGATRAPRRARRKYAMGHPPSVIHIPTPPLHHRPPHYQM